MMISKATVDTDTTEKLTVSPDTEYQDKEISSAITKKGPVESWFPWSFYGG